MNNNINIELFEELNNVENNRLYEISQLKNYSKGNIIFYEGDKPNKLKLLLDGIIKVYKVDPKGNEVVMHFFQPQTLIAETAHMQKINYPATAMCETDCQLLEIDYELFEKDFLRNPDISFKIIESLSKKVKALQNVITTNLTMDTFSRVCKFIYENQNHIDELSHRKIAAILNITPETLSRNIATLKKEELVSVEKRKIIVLDSIRLSKYC
ncbi:Crp/Fnr family transcriptional regulator [Sulfurimonas sp.]|uniref:Crp/Fnr family transcriptional regulator n=1 Tax=Sulfurimonas sp. TaxID=2022749 RepID=UPI00356B1FA8